MCSGVIAWVQWPQKIRLANRLVRKPLDLLNRVALFVVAHQKCHRHLWRVVPPHQIAPLYLQHSLVLLEALIEVGALDLLHAIETEVFDIVACN